MKTGFDGIQAHGWGLPFAAIQTVEVMRNDCVREMMTDRVSHQSISLRTDDPFPVGRLLCLRIDVGASRPVDAIGAVMSVELSDDDELGAMIVTLKGMLPEAETRWDKFLSTLPEPTFSGSEELQPERPQVDVVPKDLRSLIKLLTRELPRQWAVVHST